MDSKNEIQEVAGPGNERLTIIPSECGILPKVYHNTLLWSWEDEEALQQNWSADDKFLLRKTTPHEKSLYRKTMQYFKVYPGMLLPNNVTVCTYENKEIKNAKTGTTWIQNPNWSPRFCEYFGGIVCNPAFKDRPDFVTFIIAEAMRLRIGEDDERAPKEVVGPNHFYEDTTHIWWNEAIEECQRLLGRRPLTNDKVEVIKYVLYKSGETWFEDRSWKQAMRLVKDMIGTPPTPLQAQVLKQVLLEKPGAFESHPYYDFRRYLSKIVKKGYKVTNNPASCQLQTCDLRAVDHAWELYVKEKKDPALLTMTAYREKWYSEQKRATAASARDDDFPKWKKDWILFEHRWAETKLRIEQQAQSEDFDSY
ncbi:uncharacterized protein PAC_04527 [Phialocephala subalpina]|uniref:Uncharacterized protein n=1 Tax=Phialocephala subalpina TaxID=576137 RepID=A0A1L7WPE7_9HELO|nr:uncharacterized protein PAC_04527 [Phialocephala subalpina]